LGTLLTAAFVKGDTEIYVADSSIFTVGDDIVILDTDDDGSDNEEAVVKSVGEGKVTLVDGLSKDLPANCYVIVPADPTSPMGSHYSHLSPTPAPAQAPVYTSSVPSYPAPAPVATEEENVSPMVKELMGIPMLLIFAFLAFLALRTYVCPGPICPKSTPYESDDGVPLWIFKPRDHRPVMILTAPDYEAPEAGQMMNPGERIKVAETQPPEGGGGDVLFLKLADGRGWVLDREAGAELCYPLFVEVNQMWKYDPEHAGHMPILEEPHVDAHRTGDRLHPGEKFCVAEMQAFEDNGTLFLKLEDGRGWVYDQAETDHELLCKRIVEETWAYQPANGAPMAIRKNPEIDGEKTAQRVQPGEQFEIDEVVEGDTGVLFLHMADGRGWIFDRHPQFGDLCERIY
jgi:hypothetical protein